MSKHYGFVVIGGGSAGYAAARTARDAGLEVAIVDGSEQLGGLCILRGCMPSKTLIYAAEVLNHARHGKAFGLKIPRAEVDMAALQARKQKIIGEFADYRRGQLEAGHHDLYPSRARFVAEDRVALDDGVELSADHFLVATGSVVNEPPVPGLKGSGLPVLTSDEVLDLDTLPASVIVLGGGVVACELAQYLHRVGSRVVQIQRSEHLLKEGSPEASEVVAKAFRDEGIELFTGTAIAGVAPGGKRATRVTFRHSGSGETVVREADALLNALGRRPATDQLGLDAAGVDCAPGGHILTDGFQRTTNPRVYAAGDCAGPHEIVHVAILQGELAARHAAGQAVEAIGYDNLMTVVFTDPQVAAVGLTARHLEARGRPFLSADYPFDDHGKSILMEAPYGYVKVFADPAGGTILGAECVGKDAGELIHAFTVPVTLKATVHDLLKAHWYHPTLSEIWTYPLEDIADELAAAQAPRE